jgi:transposase-like protein
MEARKIRSAADARRCLAQVAASGQTRRAWAQDHGVDARSLNAWRLNLERGERVAPQFVELVAAAPAPAAALPAPRYRIRCGAFEVEAGTDFDERSLGRLLRVVASC